MTMLSTRPLPVETVPLDTVPHDLYREIHKALRAELFGVTVAFGSVDPSDHEAVSHEVARLHALVGALGSHREHEDESVLPLIRTHAPRLADVIETDHPVLEDRAARLEVLAEQALDAARVDRRLAVHRCYLAVASYTGEYLAHQAFEETEIMPALARAIPVERLVATTQEIIAGIPPEEMQASLRLMLPAMNADERAEMLGGMQAGAPPEVFAGVLGLAESVLAPSDFRDLVTRLAA